MQLCRSNGSNLCQLCRKHAMMPTRLCLHLPMCLSRGPPTACQPVGAAAVLVFWWWGLVEGEGAAAARV